MEDGIYYRKLVNFPAILYMLWPFCICILWPLGIFCGNLVYYSCFGMLYQINMATLDDSIYLQPQISKT
jgi:hypothetical protein